jgi:hypothetical protein
MTIRFPGRRLHVVIPYRYSHGRKFGVIPYANGFTLRAGPVAVHCTRVAS